jgi:hypothetical protein
MWKLLENTLQTNKKPFLTTLKFQPKNGKSIQSHIRNKK